MTSVILAGGKSSRLGRNKPLQLLDGKSLIQHVVDRLGSVSTEIIMVTAEGQLIPCSSSVMIKTVSDEYVGRGPLAGLYSGLAASRGDSALVVGCDMPFLNVNLLAHMYRISSTFDAVVPRVEDKVEPLCAVYSRNCIPAIRELLKREQLKINRLFSMVNVRYVGETEIDTFDPEHLTFFNINSRADLAKAHELLYGRDAG